MKPEIRRTHDGLLMLYADGAPVDGALVTAINNAGEAAGMCAVVYIPLKHAVMSEMDNVIPFRRAGG